ncbi:hypothetical protein N7507_007293 [Penicillium longicatenatum]|nr:hypothetical protein N7507_007293 [Penicillium longicatenatum]
MKTPGEDAQDGLSSTSANGVPSSQKRRPPKLRPSKLSKRTTPSDRQSEGSPQRYTAGSERSESNVSSGFPTGITKDQSQDSLNSPSQEQYSDDPQIHQRTSIRRESVTAAEPDQVEIIERGQRSNSPEANRRETRVQRMLSPEVKDKEIVRAPDPHNAGQQAELPRNEANSRTGQVIETTEAVTNTKSNDQLKLRLDLNLDVEIELKAKIRGDLTLQLLQ